MCDATLTAGKVASNTVDPDGDGIEEDLIYVDCDSGSNFAYCGKPGFKPCRTIGYAWDNIADGPGDGAEDIVCFTGTCNPDAFRLPEAYNGVPGYWTKPKTGSESRDWQFPDNPAMLVGWDTDNDGEYPPFDSDDTSVLDGMGIETAFKLNTHVGNSYFEMAHFLVRDYGTHTPDVDGGHFVVMFEVAKNSTHGHLHDLSLQRINKGARLKNPNITFPWFASSKSAYIALINIESLEEGSYTVRGNASLTGESIAGPWRFQNMTVTAHGCNKAACGSRAWKTGWKLWGWVDGIEILDSLLDANVSKWSPSTVNGIVINGHTRDWDIVNNELIDWSVAIKADGKLPEQYTFAKRYTDDIVLSHNLIRNSRWDQNISILVDGSGGNDEAVKDLWILNNILTSSLKPKAFVHINQGNTEGPNVTNIRIFNNTMFGKTLDGIKVADPGTPFRFQRLHIKNNIFAGLPAGSKNIKLDYALDYLKSDHNAFDASAIFVLAGMELSSIPDWRAITGGDSYSWAAIQPSRLLPSIWHLREVTYVPRRREPPSNT